VTRLRQGGPAAVQIGTSGWTYDGWRGPFYPKTVPKRAWLAYYASQFSTTEINGSFYRTPTPEAVLAWREATPPAFTFAWKASRFITHWKRLNENCDTSIALMESRLALLRGKLSTVWVLFRELQHRVSNNMSFIAALLRMERKAIDADPQRAAVLPNRRKRGCT
jgi:uncharacterized protein YecE (DUF72 family)